MELTSISIQQSEGDHRQTTAARRISDDHTLGWGIEGIRKISSAIVVEKYRKISNQLIKNTEEIPMYSKILLAIPLALLLFAGMH